MTQMCCFTELQLKPFKTSTIKREMICKWFKGPWAPFFENGLCCLIKVTKKVPEIDTRVAHLKNWNFNFIFGVYITWTTCNMDPTEEGCTRKTRFFGPP